MVEIDSLTSVIRLFLEIQNGGDSLLGDPLDILLIFRMRTLVDVGVTYLINEESSDEITICLANGTVDYPNNVGILPVW